MSEQGKAQLEDQTGVDWAAVRAKLAGKSGQGLWRSLEELSASPAFRANVHREFPSIATRWEDGVSRRNFLKLMAASLALAGVWGCSDRTGEQIVPYVHQPEAMVPGKPMFFATAMPFGGYGKGVLVHSREGRPIKIEGNPDHPASLGGTDSFMQASILTLYDPDRSQNVTRAGAASSWGIFWDAIRSRLESLRGKGGAGLRVLTGTVTSPTLAAQLHELRRQFPQARWHQYDPINTGNAAAGLQTALGRPAQVNYRLDHADVVVALDSDFLQEDPGSLQYARRFIDGRRVRKSHKVMNRLYVIESALSITGSMADHRLAVRPSEVRQLARELSDQLAARSGSSLPPVSGSSRDRFVGALADDLLAHRRRCLIIAGESQPPEVHALAHEMNQMLGVVGQTVQYIESVVASREESDAASSNTPWHSLATLVQEMQRGEVDTLLILGGNPGYDAPADIPFAAALEILSNARDSAGGWKHFTAHLGLYFDETAYRCQWHVPETHYLEQWGDVRAFDGTATILQPLIDPMFGGRSSIEFMEAVLGRPDRGGYEVVRAHWQSQRQPDAFEAWWSAALKKGVIDGSTAPPLAPSQSQPATQPSPRKAAPSAAGIEIVFRPDYSVWDGSWTNNPWLQELPRPFTKLTWDNAGLIAPATAERLQLSDGDIVVIDSRGRKIEVPVLVLPGTPVNTVTLHLGYGRTRCGHVGVEDDDDGPTPRGFNAYAIRTSDAPWFAGDITLEKTTRKHDLVMTRSHHAMDNLKGFDGPHMNGSLKPNAVVTSAVPEQDRELHNRRLVRVGTLEEFQKNEQFVKDLGGASEKKPLLSLYQPWDYSQGYQWGMSIDQTACIGCNACVVACQAENNIPVVGKEEVAHQREMHWLRIDSYFGGSLDDPHVYHQPVPCMHCENAPCEYVCPTGATTHSAEGLNQMTYNRCVGTRYCSNNCPYKVRRFNFLSFADMETTPGRKLQRNPDVTVRSNGVMEKCTYCVQRLNRTRIEAERMLVELREQARTATSEQDRQRLLKEAGDREFEMLERLQTACQQACPTQAIVFGSILPVGGHTTHVAELKGEPLDYSLLRELTTKPRTTYMARVRNPNPALETGGEA